MVDLGWTRDQVLDQVDTPFLEKLHEVWADYPPVRVMIGAYLGLEPKGPPSKNFTELLGMFPDGTLH